MKRLVLVAATLGMAVSSAYAEEAVEMKANGEFRLRYENLVNPTGVKDAKDGESGFDQRFKLGVTARAGETLQAYLGVIHGARWGYQDNVSGNTGDGAGVPAGDDTENDLVVYRAWGWWKASDMLSFKFGRFGIEMADGAVFSENDWEAMPVAHEGVLGTWDADFAKIGFFGIKTDEYTLGALSSDPERNLYGIMLDFKNMPEAIKMANLHFIQDVSDEITGQGKINAQRFGLTVGGDAANVMYKATAAFVTGKEKDRVTPADTDINSMMYDLMVGYMMPEVMNMKISAGFHSDTGDKSTTGTKNEGYDAFYYDRHNYAGLMDVVRWGNLTYWNVNWSMMPSETIETGIGYYMFSRTTEEATTDFGPNYGITSSGSTEKSIGSEVDVFANKAYENGFKIGLRYGAFMPGKGLKDAPTAPSKETIQQIFAQAAMSF